MSGGAPVAFGVELHRLTLLRFAATLVPIGDVEDLVQDSLARAWKKRDGCDPTRGSLLSWLLAIVATKPAHGGDAAR